MPIGLALAPLAYRRLAESLRPGAAGSTCPASRSAASACSASSTASSAATSSAGRRRRSSARSSPAPPRSPRSSPGSCARPPRCCRCASSARAPSRPPTASRFAMYFGVFGSIFLLAQFFQVTQGLSPLEAGLRTLPWTAMPMLVAPIAGLLSDRIGSRPLMATGLALQAIAIGWLAAVSVARPSPTPRSSSRSSWPAPAWRSCSRRRPTPCSTRSARRRPARPRARPTRSARSAARSASPCSPRCSRAHGSYASPQAFTDGMTSAIWVGAAVLAVGALIALLVPGKPRAARPQAAAQVREPSLARVELAHLGEDGVGHGLLLVARRLLDALVGERLAVVDGDLRELQALPVAHVRGADDRHGDDRRAAQQRQAADPAPGLRRELAVAGAAALGVHGHRVAAVEDRDRGGERLLVGDPAADREHAAVRVDRTASAA